MTNEEKVKMLVNQLPKDAHSDFIYGFEQGASIALSAENNTEAVTNRNLKLIGDFVEYLKEHDLEVPENVMVGFFEQEDTSTLTE